MAITSSSFSVYEKLASSKMNGLVTDINAHTHDGTYGTKINYSNLIGTISAAAIANSTITSAMIVDGTIVTGDIASDTIAIGDINRTSIHLSADGYAVYAP